MIDYKNSGVDIEAGDNLVSWLQIPQKNEEKSELNQKLSSNLNSNLNKYSDIKDFKNRTLSGIGGFAALYDIAFPHIKNPALISCTDGVGTKVKIASYFQDYSTVGQDLVAMCANDLICTGGTPLFFLDYYATGKLDLEAAKQFLTSVREACEKSHMILIGGETAEMPGVYQAKDFDCAGFSIGIVDKEKTWGPHLVKENDVVIGIESSGYHSNGFSVIRKVFEGEYDKYKKWLLEPTRLYVEAALMLKKEFNVHAMAHITGGGIENLPRVMPENMTAHLKQWNFPESYQELQKRSQLSTEQMLQTFNCGMGLMYILSEEEAQNSIHSLQEMGYAAQVLGKIKLKKESEPHVLWI